MRKLWMLTALCGGLLVISCKQNSTENSVAASKNDSAAKADSERHSKLVVGLASDTNRHNFTDAKGKRQGWWTITNREMNLPGYDTNAKVEEGAYKDGMKEGEWTEYNADGSVKSSSVFKDGNLVK